MKAVCKKCGAEFNVRPAKIKHGRGKFCSVGCYRQDMIGKKQTQETKKKRSLSLKGRKQTKSERLAKSIAMKKRDWGDRKTPINELARKSIEIRLWREAVFARDNWTCQKCDQVGGKLNAHHIKNFSEHKEFRTSIENGATLCYKCHTKLHKKFGKKTDDNDYMEFLNQ